VSPFTFDAHVDTLQLALDLGADLGVASPGQLDLPRARIGGLGGAVFTAWVDPRSMAPGRGGARARAEALFDRLDDLLAAHPEAVQLVRSAADWRAARESGRFALVAGMEGGHPLDGSLQTLEHFAGRGLRVLTLVWNNHLDWVRSCQPGGTEGVPEGLSGFGEHVVRRCNELGIVVDLSHAGERSFFDAIEAGERPVIASHSGCRALHDHPRNLTDDQLRALAANGGVVGVPFLPSFLDAGAQRRAAEARDTDGYRALRAETDAGLEVERTRYLAGVLEPLPIERLVDHVAHAARVAGVEHVGLGSDFDGIVSTVAGLEDASGYGALAEALRARGFDADEVAAVMGGNLERVLLACLPDGDAPRA
jgi:membrane dipeptidase